MYIQNNLIEQLLDQFHETTLTNQEEIQLERLEKNYVELLSYENTLFSASKLSLMEIRKKFSDINDNLNALSKIQLSES